MDVDVRFAQKQLQRGLARSILGAGSIMHLTSRFYLCHPFSSDLERIAMTAIAYLAGPDVFLPNAVAHAATRVEICRRLGLRGLPPLNENADCRYGASRPIHSE
jgi:hypothetical protein